MLVLSSYAGTAGRRTSWPVWSDSCHAWSVEQSRDGEGVGCNTDDTCKSTNPPAVHRVRSSASNDHCDEDHWGFDGPPKLSDCFSQTVLTQAARTCTVAKILSTNGSWVTGCSWLTEKAKFFATQSWQWEVLCRTWHYEKQPILHLLWLRWFRCLTVDGSILSWMDAHHMQIALQRSSRKFELSTIEMLAAGSLSVLHLRNQATSEESKSSKRPETNQMTPVGYSRITELQNTLSLGSLHLRNVWHVLVHKPVALLFWKLEIRHLRPRHSNLHPFGMLHSKCFAVLRCFSRKLWESKLLLVASCY